MKSFRYTITDETGIHARPAGLLVKEAQKYISKIVLAVGEKQTEAKKLIAVMALGVKCGETVEVFIDGEDEEQAFFGMKNFFEQNL